MLYDPLFRCDASDRSNLVTAGRPVNREWWDSLSVNEQRQYLQDNPGSMYKKLGIKHGDPRKLGQSEPTNIEKVQDQKLGNTPGDQAVKALNKDVDEKLRRLKSNPELQKALEANSPNRVRAAKSIRENQDDIIDKFKQSVPPEGVSKTADALRNLMSLPPETPDQALRNSLFSATTMALARTAFIHYAGPHLGIGLGGTAAAGGMTAASIGMSMGTAIPFVIGGIMLRNHLKKRSQAQNIKKIEEEAKQSKGKRKLPTMSSFLTYAAAVEDDFPDVATLKQMNDDEVFKVFLNNFASTLESANIPLSHWARGFKLETPTPDQQEQPTAGEQNEQPTIGV